MILEAGGKCPWCDDQRKLLPSEAEIHHIDGDRNNNSLENLILTCRNHHGQIGGSLIPMWEVMLKKTCLSNPGTLERLGLQPVNSKPVIEAKEKVKRPVVGGANSGIAAETINNSGTMAGTIKFSKPPKGPVHVAGSLVTSADHYSYVDYLIKRLSHYRSWRPGAKGPADNPGAVRKIFEREMGRLPKDYPLERFNDAVGYLIAKIEKTALGKMGKAKVSTFDQWKKKGSPAA